MGSSNLWKRIISELSKAMEIPTIRRNATKERWFSACSMNNTIVINGSKVNKPSSKLKCARKINEKEFIEVYPHYQPWKDGKESRVFMRELSQNTSYILALINHFEEKSTPKVS